MKISTMLKTISVFVRSSWMTSLVIAVALSFPLSAYIFSKNIQSIADYLKTTNTITLYLSKENTPAQNNDLLAALKSNLMVENSRYISPDEGLKELQTEEQFGNVLTEFSPNPLPAAILVQLSDSVQTADQANQLFMQLKQWPGVTHATMDTAWLQRFNALLISGHRIKIAFLFFFSTAIVLLALYTMSQGSTIQPCPKEIRLLRTIGTWISFIQSPFLLVGAMSGLIGGMLAWLLVEGWTHWLHEPWMELSRLYNHAFAFQNVSLPMILFLMISGILLGLINAYVSVKRYSEIKDLNQ